MNIPGETEPSKTIENIHYSELSFVVKFSKFTQFKIQKLAKQFCKESTIIKIVFNTSKLTSFFSTKDKVLYRLNSNVLYKIFCTYWNTHCFGET